MTKVLGLVHAEMSSHTIRIVEIALALTETGRYDVIISGKGPFMELARQRGLKCVETPTVTKKQLYDKLEGQVVSTVFDPENTDRIFEIEKKLLREHKPDIIIRDLFREMAGIAAKQPDTRCLDIFVQKVALCPHYHFTFRPDDLPGWVDLIPKGFLKPFEKPLEKFFRKKNAVHIRRKVRSLGLKKYESIEGVKPDFVLFPESKEVFDLPEIDGEKYKFIGPILTAKTGCEPEWLEEYKQRENRILISMGTTGEHEQNRFIAEVFKDTGWAVALDTNDGCNIKGFFGCSKFDPQHVLPCTDVFVTHGGSGSGYMGLKYKVPMLALHDHFEQQVNAFEFAQKGLAIYIPKRQRTVQNVRTAVQTLLTDSSYKENIKRVSEKTFSTDPLALAVKYIDEAHGRFKAGAF